MFNIIAIAVVGFLFIFLINLAWWIIKPILKILAVIMLIGGFLGIHMCFIICIGLVLALLIGELIINNL
jgi:hypothetical protein